MDKFGYYTSALKKYAKFDGRASVKEFWYFILFNFVIGFILSLINRSLGGLYNLAVLIPSIAIGSRRLHDIGKSGWTQLVALIPIAGWIWIIILFVKKGDKDKNKYGVPSKATSGNAMKDLKELKEKASDLGDKITNTVEDLGNKVEDKIEDITDKE